MSEDGGDRGGATAVEMSLVWLAMLLMVGAAVQVALVFHAGQLALTAAEDGLRSGRYADTPSADEARADATAFLARAAGTSLQEPHVAATLDPTAGVLRVEVRGRALSLLPGVEFEVRKQAVGAIERVTP